MNARTTAQVLLVAGALVTGCTSAPAATNQSATEADEPTAAEKMICGDEIHSDIATAVGLPSQPASTDSWSDNVYTCVYALPMGTFVVSVRRSPGPAEALAYFADLRTQLSPTETMPGLGQAAFGTAAGKVVLVKDNDTLIVDATALPAVFGTQQSKRFDFAYQMAADILGCWTGE